LPRGFLTLLIGRLAAAQPAAVVAQPPPAFALAIEKDELAAACPELPWFRERIAAHAGPAGQAGDFAVELSRKSEAWYARIQSRARAGEAATAERVLRDRSPGCGPLAEAVVITIAILADDVAQHAEPSVAPQSEPPPVAVEKAAGVRPIPRDSRHQLWLGAGGGITMAWISPLAPALGFGLGFETAHTRHGVRLMLTTEQKFELVPGRVVVQAWLGTAFSCAQLTNRRFGAALCATFDASLLRASAEGFDEGQPSSRSYGALGIEVQPSWYVSDSYRISAVIAALAPFSRESFSVIGRGVAYIPPSLNWRVLLFSEIGTF
jgi:hypothetical protein